MPEEEAGPPKKEKKQRPSAREIVSSIFEGKKEQESTPQEESALFRKSTSSVPPLPLVPTPPAQAAKTSGGIKLAAKPRNRMLRTARILAKRVFYAKRRPFAIPKAGRWTAYSEYPVGIEIGATAVKAVQLASQNGKWELINCAIRPLRHNGTISMEDSLKELKSALADIFPDPRAHLYAASAFTDPTSTTQVIKLPQIPQAEMKRAVAWELQEKFSMRSDDWYFDFAPLNPLPGSPQKEIPVLIAAVPKRELRIHTDILKSAGLLPASVEVKPLPTLDLLAGYPWPSEDAGLLVELGAEASYVVIMVNSQLTFIHSLEFTGGILTKVIQGISGLSHKDAEQFKCRVGLSRTTPSASGTGEVPQENLDQEHQAYLALRPFVDRFITEIEQVFKYYSFRVSMSEVRSFSKIALCGKTANLKGLKELLEEKLNIPVSFVDSFANVNVDHSVFNPAELEAESLGLVTAMGLAQQKMVYE
ncbi:MAG: pilus assembly protein PilM [Candidatus Omnitrophica bacterium]|nr:pilus assembly protein PilM [Candidatus Omnitrophota bacterium]